MSELTTVTVTTSRRRCYTGDSVVLVISVNLAFLDRDRYPVVTIVSALR